MLTSLVFTLLQVFINQETAEGYKLLFEQVFSLISEVCERPVQFHYLHGSGIKAIVVDMDAKQMSGELKTSLVSCCD